MSAYKKWRGNRIENISRHIYVRIKKEWRENRIEKYKSPHLRPHKKTNRGLIDVFV